MPDLTDNPRCHIPDGRRSVIPESWFVLRPRSSGVHECADWRSVHWLAASVGPTATQCLWHLANTPPQHRSDAAQLSDNLGVPRSAIYKQLDRLRLANYIRIDLTGGMIIVPSHLPVITDEKRRRQGDPWRQRYSSWLARPNA